MGRRGGRIGVAETLSGVHGLECLVVGGEVEPSLLDPEPEGVFGPDVAAFGREQQRHGLVVVVDSREILFGELRRIGHPVSQGDEAAHHRSPGSGSTVFSNGGCAAVGDRQAASRRKESRRFFIRVVIWNQKYEKSADETSDAGCRHRLFRIATAFFVSHRFGGGRCGLIPGAPLAASVVSAAFPSCYGRVPAACRRQRR